MDREGAMQLIYAYFEGWREHDQAKILDTLDPDCVIVECYGPVYRGTARVAQWLNAWFGEGNRVDRWDITSLLVGNGGVAVEWRFACTWHGTRAEFEGASIARFKGDKIVYLREYQTTAPLYDWEGVWHP
jgi:ketosteroid isomerase-like protein